MVNVTIYSIHGSYGVWFVVVCPKFNLLYFQDYRLVIEHISAMENG